MEVKMGITAAFMVPHPPLIVPDIGRGQEQIIPNTTESYQEIARRIGQLQPDTIVLLTPHQIMYTDYFHTSDNFGRDT